MIKSYDNKHIGTFFSYPTKELENVQPIDILYLGAYMNRNKNMQIADVYKTPHYEKTMKKWSSMLGDTIVDLENNIEEISQKLKLNTQIFYPKTDRTIGGSNHSKQSYRRVQLLKMKKYGYKPIFYGGAGFGNLESFWRKTKEETKEESIDTVLFDLNNREYGIAEWNTLLNEKLPSNTHIVYQINDTNVKKIPEYCNSQLDRTSLKVGNTNMTNLLEDGIQKIPIGFTVNPNDDEKMYYTGKFAYYKNNSGKNVCFNTDVIDILSDNGRNIVFKCPYTRVPLVTFKDILIRYKNEIENKDSILVKKINSYLQKTYGNIITLGYTVLEGQLIYEINTFKDYYEFKFSLDGLKNVEDLKLEINGAYEDVVITYYDDTMNEIITKLTNITELYIMSTNERFTIPENIINLTSLQNLCIYDSALESIPESIINIPNLQKLDITHNVFLKKLPDTIGNLTSLKHLDISYNDALETLPESITKIMFNLESFIVEVDDDSKLNLSDDLKDAFIRLKQQQEQKRTFICNNNFENLLME